MKVRDFFSSRLIKMQKEIDFVKDYAVSNKNQGVSLGRDYDCLENINEQSWRRVRNFKNNKVDAFIVKNKS